VEIIVYWENTDQTIEEYYWAICLAGRVYEKDKRRSGEADRGSR
jgi:hypothetical protein